MAFKFRSRRTLLIAACVAVVVLVIIAILAVRSTVSSRDEDEDKDIPRPVESVSASASGSPSASPERTGPVNPISDEEAADRTRDALDRTATALSDPGNPADLSDVLTDGELDAYLAQADEFMSTGVHQSGSPSIENPTVTSVSEDGATMTVQACVDSSSVQVLNDQGTDLHASQPKRSLTIFTLTNPDGSWKLAGESFPDDPTC